MKRWCRECDAENEGVNPDDEERCASCGAEMGRASEDEMNDDDAKRIEAQKRSRMLYVNGSNVSYRCGQDGGPRCGCNVFTEIEPGVYQCNACKAVYRGESR